MRAKLRDRTGDTDSEAESNIDDMDVDGSQHSHEDDAFDDDANNTGGSHPRRQPRCTDDLETQIRIKREFADASDQLGVIWRVHHSI